MSLWTRFFELPLAYRLTQAPFAADKLAPLYRHSEVFSFKRVLDVGCGPGTNAPHFSHCDYLGIDINPDYIADARRRHGRRFEVADVTQWDATREQPFDAVVMNSLLHHLTDAESTRLLQAVCPAIAPNGCLHLFDLVLPAELSISYALAKLDRGDHPRPVRQWRSLFAESFEVVAEEEYSVGIAGQTLWQMIYLKGKARG